jgi:hypothetical protein
VTSLDVVVVVAALALLVVRIAAIIGVTRRDEW